MLKKATIEKEVRKVFDRIESVHPNWLECDECSDIMGQAKAMLDGERGTVKEFTLVHWKLFKLFAKCCLIPIESETIYSKYEGEILGAIDKVFKGNWWGRLNASTQEEIHDALHRVLAVKL